MCPESDTDVTAATEPVEDSTIGLVREVGWKADGRRITYYALPDERDVSAGAAASSGA